MKPLTFDQLKQPDPIADSSRILPYFTPEGIQAPFRCSAALFGRWEDYRAYCAKQDVKLRGCLCKERV